MKFYILSYLFGYMMEVSPHTHFTLPKQSQRSRPILYDGPGFFGLFWKEKLCLITEEIRYYKIWLPQEMANILALCLPSILYLCYLYVCMT